MRLSYLYVVVLLICCSQISYATPVLNKLYFHPAVKTQRQSIELGQVILYFSQEPTIDEHVQQQANKTIRTITCKSCTITDQRILRMIEKINNQAAQQAYRIQITVEPEKQQVVLTLSYEPEKIAYTREVINTITQDKGLLIHLYDRALLHKLQQTNKPLLELASNHRPRVVIDCGHGGSEPGARSPSGLVEKDLTMSIGMHIAQELNLQPIDFFFTRLGDVNVDLDQRVALIRHLKPDLVVSIHANAAPKDHAEGIETFYAKYIPCFAASEIGYAEQGLIQGFWTKIYQESAHFADIVHNAILHEVKTEYMPHNRGTKCALGCLSAAAQTPMALIEVGFLTHPREHKVLERESYQRALARGISRGILQYFKLEA